jgi:hypothetical protein
MRDEVNKQWTPTGLDQQETTQPKRTDLLGRLHQRRRELENALRRVNNSIEFVEKNAGMVEIVEIVLASREKCEPGLL